jgi:hypothetical protein
MLGRWFVLAGPRQSINDGGLFVSSDLINRTLRSIEETEGLFLDLSHIWLPNKLLALKEQNFEVRGGDVYRLTPQLFLQCYRFSSEMITEDEWLKYCESHSNAIKPSPKETAAFRDWRRGQIMQSSERYHHPDYAKRRLPRKKVKE